MTKPIDILRAHRAVVVRANAYLDALPEDKERFDMHAVAQLRNDLIIEQLDREILEERLAEL